MKYREMKKTRVNIRKHKKKIEIYTKTIKLQLA